MTLSGICPVIPNLVRDLGFEFWVLKPRPVGGALYFEIRNNI
jgi:hypothetical protein